MRELHRPRSLSEILELARSIPGRKCYLAGGTDLAVQRRSGALPDGTFISIGAVAELAGIAAAGEEIRIGAATSIAAILASPLVRARLPFLAECLALFASPQIRSMATIGGNIANGSPTADTLPPLLVMDARLELACREGKRHIPLSAFATGYKRNVLRDGEILSAVLIRAGALEGFQTYYRKVGARVTMTIAKVALAVALKRGSGSSGPIEEARIAVGSLNEYARRLGGTERALRSSDPRALGAARIAQAVESEITPISDFRSDAAYRARVCTNLLLGFLGVGDHSALEA